MMSNLLRFQDKQKYLVFDFETEGLNLLSGNRPWQLSYLLCEGDRIVKESDSYIWWADLNVGKEAAIVTRFDYNKYKKLARPAAQILSEFETHLYNEEYIIVGQNLLGFDIYIHNIYRSELDLPPDWSYIPRVIDTNALSKAHKLSLNVGENRIAWMFKTNNFRKKGLKTSLGLMGKELEIPFDYESTHDGLQDVRLNFLVWNKLKWMVDI
jgi:DNA polymerase III epsilon subunit-like protein